MKKFIAMFSAMILCCSYSPVCVNAVEDIALVTTENSPELWERFLKYDLRITDYDSLTDEEKDLCEFIFETELNSEDTIICERARRILNGYDVGRRATIEDTENYYDFADFSFLYGYLTNEFYYKTPYLNVIPDIKHIDYDMNYNEYWLNDTGNQKILSTGEVTNYGCSNFEDAYGYVELDKDGNIITTNEIKRYSISLKIITDETFTYAVYPDNTLYVLNANEHFKSYEIPEEVNGMKVIGIKLCAFQNEGCYDVTLPESIEYIEPLAFAGCTFLESITLPENLKFIGTASFIDCNSLKNITVNCPDLICETPIFNCCDAENVFLNFRTIPSSMLSVFNNIDNLTFGDDVVELGILFANSKFMKDYSYTIPETVKYINRDIASVYNDYYSEDLVVPATVEVFGAYATPASGKYESNLLSFDGIMAVIENKCRLTSDTVISGYYGTEAHSYALAYNLKFNPLDDITYGDSNGDNVISVADMVSLSQYLLNNAEITWGADLTKDGMIDSFDMIPMRKMVLNNK